VTTYAMGKERVQRVECHKFLQNGLLKAVAEVLTE
jgi:hypothetical protein